MLDPTNGSDSQYIPSPGPLLAGLPASLNALLEARVFIGLRGDSNSSGHLLLYPTLDQSRFIEIANDDVLETEPLHPDQSPFGDLGGLRVRVRAAARVTTGLATALPGRQADDDFDLDIRLGMAGGIRKHEECIGTEDGTTCNAECQDDTAGCEDTDGCDATEVCETIGCPPQTRATCGAEHTCVTCDATCRTCETCHTCNTCRLCETREACPTGPECEFRTRATCALAECEIKA